MEYQEFLNKVQNDLKEHLPEELKNSHIQEQEVKKLQGQSYTGIAIMTEEGTSAVTMDLKPFYDSMAELGQSYSSVLNEIADTVAIHNQNRPEINLAEMNNYEIMKEKLVLQVVGKEGNEDMLSQIPYQDMEDLAVVYRFNMEEKEEIQSSILVTNYMLENYRIDQEQLHQDAIENAKVNQPVSMQTMEEVISELMGISIPIPEEPDMFVATTKSKIYGAAVIAYPNFFEETAEKLKGDFFILPSSIHEVIMVPDQESRSVSELKRIVNQVNSEQISQKDFLSNHIYHYDAQERRFELAEKFEARKQSRGEQKDSVLKDLNNKREILEEKKPSKKTSDKKQEMSR